jgi:hypothetical protein
MVAYKFLGRGAVGLLSGYAWPAPSEDGPGAWVGDGARDEPSRGGVHACRLEDLPAWIDDELYTIELAAPVIERESVLVAPRGRLLRLVEGWTPETARQAAEACVWRTRDRAVELLRASSLPTAELEASSELAALQSAAAAQAGAPGPSGTACGYVADCVSLLRGARPDEWAPDAPAPAVTPGAVAANLGFVAAHIAGFAASAGGSSYDGGFEAERAAQRAWLAARLELESRPPA